MTRKNIFLLIALMLCVACSRGDQKSLATTEQAVPPAEEFVPTPLDPKNIPTPMQSIKNLDQMVEGYHLGQSLSPQQIDENKKLKQTIIRGTFDIKELCRLSLGKHWEAITEVDRKNFVELMTKLLETKAVLSKEQLHGPSKYYGITYSKEVYDDPKSKDKATVSSRMNVPKENIILDITYKVLLTPYGWKIYDVIVDDSSLLLNYKDQFNRIITQEGGFSELTRRMENKLKEFNQKGGQTA